MKNTFKKLLFFLAMGLLLQASKCNNDPEPDFCLGAEPVTARFSMGMRVVNNIAYAKIDTLIVSDTVFTDRYITFLADEDYDSYEWTVGSDQRVFTNKSFTLYFNDPESDLEIRLIARRTSFLDCFPEDDGIDTLVQHLTIIDDLESLVYGNFRGYLEENPEDEFIVSIQDDFGFIATTNINKNCSPAVFGFHIQNSLHYKTMYLGEEYKPFYMREDEDCLDPRGWIMLAENGNDIIIEYSTGPEPIDRIVRNPEVRVYHRFVGTRVP